MFSEDNLSTRLINLSPANDAAEPCPVLLETDSMKVSCFRLRADEETTTHETEGEVLIECRDGEVLVSTLVGEQQLTVGQAVHLRPCVPHRLRAIAESIVLVTSVTKPQDSVTNKDAVEEASEESFPASDPPSWTPVTSA